MKTETLQLQTPENRVKSHNTDGGTAVTIDIGSNDHFDIAVTSVTERKATTYKGNTVVDYSDSNFDWSIIHHQFDSIMSEPLPDGERFANTTVVIADCENPNTLNTVFAISGAINNVIDEL